MRRRLGVGVGIGASSRGLACSLLGAWLGLAGGLAGCECAEPVVPPEPFRFTAVHLPGFRLSLDDEASIERLEGAVGPLTMVGGLNVAIFGGDAIANEDADAGRAELEALGSVAGILVAKRFAVLGTTELKGKLPAGEVTAELLRLGLLPASGTSYSTPVGPHARLIVVGPRPSPGWIQQALAAGQEPFVVVASHRLPPPEVRQALEADPRAVVVLFTRARGDAVPATNAGSPHYLETPAGRTRTLSVFESGDADGQPRLQYRTWLDGVDPAAPGPREAPLLELPWTGILR